MEIWFSGEGVEFVSADGKAAYQYRAGIIKDAVQLKKRPDRVPAASWPTGPLCLHPPCTRAAMALSIGCALDDARANTLDAFTCAGKKYGKY